MLRRNPLDEDERTVLRKARLQVVSGPSLSQPIAGAEGGISSGATDDSGNFRRAGLTNIDLTEAFYTAKG